MLDWRLVLPQLSAASMEHIEDLGLDRPPSFTTTGPDWEEARREGCGSPLELRLLRAMREAGMEEPEKQFEVRSPGGQLLTLADFAFLQQRVLIYVDGLAFHSALRQRIHDTVRTNQLQSMGYLVLRFIGPQVMSAPGQCVSQVQQAIETRHSQ
jgi:very-short-patch-repair endonuclease